MDDNTELDLADESLAHIIQFLNTKDLCTVSQCGVTQWRLAGVLAAAAGRIAHIDNAGEVVGLFVYTEFEDRDFAVDA